MEMYNCSNSHYWISHVHICNRYQHQMWYHFSCNHSWCYLNIWPGYSFCPFIGFLNMCFLVFLHYCYSLLYCVDIAEGKSGAAIYSSMDHFFAYCSRPWGIDRTMFCDSTLITFGLVTTATRFIDHLHLSYAPSFKHSATEVKLSI